jgi:hypothetical protein
VKNRVTGLLLTCLPLLFWIRPVLAQELRADAQIKPIETTVCKILEDPASFNSKLVRVRGHVVVTFEYSTIEGDGCSGSIWFAYGNGSAPPGFAAYVNGAAKPGATNAKGGRVEPIRVTLVRDSNFDRFEKLLTSTVKPNAHPANEFAFQLVTATLVGRIDGVSKQIHATHRKRSPTDDPDFKGFGQMGLFDAQLVIGAVESDSVVESLGLIRGQEIKDEPPPTIP